MARVPAGAALCDRLLFGHPSATPLLERAATEGGEAPLVLYPRRWLMLLLFCLLSCVNGAMWIQFASVANICQSYYGTTALAIDWLSMIYMLIYIPGMAPAVRFFERHGLRRGVLAGAALNAAGALLRWHGAGARSFGWTFAGQTVCSVAQCFTLGVPPMLSAAWFGPRERARATSVGVLSNQLGGALGLLSSAVVRKGQDLPPLLGGTAIASVAILALLVLGLQSAPPPPPSRSQQAIQAEAGSRSHDPAAQSEYAQLMRHVPFLLLLAAYGIVVGVYYAIGTLINVVLLPSFGSSPAVVAQCGWVGATLVLAGVPGVLLCGAFLDHTGWFHSTARCLFALSALSMCAFSASVQWGTMLSVFVSAGAVGFFVTALVAAGFEFAAELTCEPSPSLLPLSCRG